METSRKVLVYSVPTCPHCKRLKQFLEERGVSFQSIDVASDKAARDEMVKKTGQMSVPVTVVDGKIVVGFDEDRIKEALGL
jgi:glutaredoxin-like YruB-family protein